VILSRIVNICFALFLMSIGMVFFWNSFSYGYWASYGPGAALLPRWLSGGLVIASLFVIFSDRKYDAEFSLSSKGLLKIITAVSFICATVIMVPFIGLIPSLAIFMLCFSFFLEGNSILLSVLVSLLTSLFLFFVFGVLLGVQFPEMYFF